MAFSPVTFHEALDVVHCLHTFYFVVEVLPMSLEMLVTGIKLRHELLVGIVLLCLLTLMLLQDFFLLE